MIFNYFDNRMVKILELNVNNILIYKNMNIK